MKIRFKKGYSIVELVVAMAIVVIVSTGALLTLTSASKIFTQSQVKTHLIYEMENIMTCFHSDDYLSSVKEYVGDTSYDGNSKIYYTSSFQKSLSNSDSTAEYYIDVNYTNSPQNSLLLKSFKINDTLIYGMDEAIVK